MLAGEREEGKFKRAWRDDRHQIFRVWEEIRRKVNEGYRRRERKEVRRVKDC